MLKDLKKHVMNVAKKAQRDGLCKHKSGNFSALDEASGLFVITPSGVDREELTVDDMIVMDLQANVIENKTGLKPSSEALMHIRIYQSRRDVRAIAHTHSFYATVFAVLNKEIPPFVYEAMNLKTEDGYVRVAPYGRPGTRELAESVVAPLQKSDCVLMKGHGAVAVDEDSIENAYLRASYLEELAGMYYSLLTANNGQDPELFAAEELQKWAYPSEIHFPGKEQK